MSTRIIFHVDVDAFFASAEQSLNPFLRGKPVIVGGYPHQRGVVHTSSYEARKFGVRTGMPLSQARRLCPQAFFVKGNFLHYKSVSKQLLKIFQSFSPVVEFSSLDDAYIDMSGTQRQFPGSYEAALQIQKTAEKQLHLPVSIGIGSSKLISRLASSQRKPRGITLVEPGKEKQFLHPLPVSQLPGVGPVTEKLLLELGIRTVGELASLPKLPLMQLLGANGKKLWEFANGLDTRPVEPFRPPKQISRETTFEEDTDDMQLILATFQYLCERIAMKLRKLHVACGRLAIKLRYSDFKHISFSRKLPFHTQDATVLNATLQQLLKTDQMRRVRIRHVHISVADLEPENWQLQLFQPGNRTNNGDLLRSIDEIRNRYGFMAILPAKTAILQTKYRMGKDGYILHTPSLSQ